MGDLRGYDLHTRTARPLAPPNLCRVLVPPTHTARFRFAALAVMLVNVHAGVTCCCRCSTACARRVSRSRRCLPYPQPSTHSLVQLTPRCATTVQTCTQWCGSTGCVCRKHQHWPSCLAWQPLPALASAWWLLQHCAAAASPAATFAAGVPVNGSTSRPPSHPRCVVSCKACPPT